jgi:glycerophosphoryl diester phosphodiesterase
MELDIKKSKILGSYYDVNYIDDLKDPIDNHKLDGRIIEDSHLIKIDKNLDYQSQLKSLFHEDIHAICWEFAIEDPEKFVRFIANGIFALIIDNPEFIKKILEFAELCKKEGGEINAI